MKLTINEDHGAQMSCSLWKSLSHSSRNGRATEMSGGRLLITVLNPHISVEHCVSVCVPVDSPPLDHHTCRPQPFLLGACGFLLPVPNDPSRPQTHTVFLPSQNTFTHVLKTSIYFIIPASRGTEISSLGWTAPTVVPLWFSMS